MKTNLLLIIPLLLFFTLPVTGFAGGGCGPSDNCSGATSLNSGTLYSYGNSGCGINNDCDDCYNTASCPLCVSGGAHREDCYTEIMGLNCFLNGAFCGSPENTSWAQFCPSVSGSYDFTVSNISCSGGGASLQFGIYQAGVNCNTNTQNNLLSCSSGATSTTTYTHTLTGGQCYLIVFDGNAGAACTWDFIITAPPLPVTLDNFDISVKNEGVTLSWTTLNETNNAYYLIRRKYDNLVREENMTMDQTENQFDVKEFKVVPESSGSKTKQSYLYSDHDPKESGTYIYELLQVDRDGTQHFLARNEVYIGAPVENALTRVYPNPAKDKLNLEYSVSETSIVTISLYNLAGAKVREEIIGKRGTGYYKESVSIRDLASGVYFYQIRIDGQSFSGKIMKY